MSPLKNPPFGSAVQDSLYKTAVLCMSKRSLMEMGQRASCGPITSALRYTRDIFGKDIPGVSQGTGIYQRYPGCKLKHENEC